MAKILRELPQIVVEEIKIKDYEVVFLYEAITMQFFGIMVDWYFRKDLVTVVLNWYSADEVEVWFHEYDESKMELNQKLIDLILYNIEND